MKPTRAVIVTEDKSGRQKEASRLGGRCASATVHTHRTLIDTTIWSDGHGVINVKRDGETIASYVIKAEAAR